MWRVRRLPRIAGAASAARRFFAGSEATWRAPVLAAGGLTIAGLAGGAGLLLARGKTVDIDIRPITDEVFDHHDDLFVFYFEKAEDLRERREDFHRIISTLMQEPSLSRVSYWQNVRKEGDPQLPGGESEEQVIRVVMYKGQRKSVLLIGEEIPKTEILDFYKPVSQDLSKLKAPKNVPLVSGESFQKDVVQATGRKVLLQMYEDTCFLCFLMRPFVNSLADLLLQEKAPFVIKRLNIEKNDFPEGCPVARGTPTFAYFQAKAKPVKWEEFKPKDLCEKILKVFPALSEQGFERMDELQSLVSRRFQLFTQLVMWSIELQKLEACLADAAPDTGPEDSDFNAILQQLMAKDMRRVDSMEENLAFLKQQVDEVEHDAVVLGIMLGREVQKLEVL